MAAAERTNMSIEGDVYESLRSMAEEIGYWKRNATSVAALLEGVSMIDPEALEPLLDNAKALPRDIDASSY